MRTIYRNVIASRETNGFVGKSIDVRLIIFAFDVDHVRARYTLYNPLFDKEAFTSKKLRYESFILILKRFVIQENFYLPPRVDINRMKVHSVRNAEFNQLTNSNHSLLTEIGFVSLVVKRPMSV